MIAGAPSEPDPPERGRLEMPELDAPEITPVDPDTAVPGPKASTDAQTQAPSPAPPPSDPARQPLSVPPIG